MHITTVHTLLFSVRCDGAEQNTAAMAIIKTGAANMGLTVSVTSSPLPEGQSATVRTSNIEAHTSDREKCEHYWGEVSRALALIGVEPTSP